MTPKELTILFDQLEMTRGEAARQIGVSSKTLANWMNGIYPINPVKAKKLLRLLKKKETPEEEKRTPTKVEAETANWPIYLQAKGIKRLFSKYDESYAAFGRRLDTSGLSIRYWIEGKYAPSDKFREPLRLLWKDAFESTPGTVTLARRPAAMSSAVLAAEPLLELSTEFYNEYRGMRNQQDVNAVISFSAKKVGMDAEALRQALAFVLLTLKKEMNIEDIYRCLTGHVQ